MINVEEYLVDPFMDIEYPYIGECTVEDCRVVVLFTSEDTGVCLQSSNWDMYSEGEYRDDWNEEDFEWYEHELIISND